MTTIPDIDYDAARERLSSITTDPAALASFDSMVESEAAGDAEAFDDDARIARWNDAMGAFLGNNQRLNISLDWLFLGKGEPLLSAA
jgi:hypothetical protein